MAKIYPQSIDGKFRRIKDYSIIALLLLYLLGSWVRYDRGGNSPDQAIFIDLPNQKAYFFAVEIWPQETYYITGILILAALGLFFVTSLFGRIWCGYACPHTVFTDLFVKIETFFQGDRNSRIKLDSMPMNKEKFLKKLATHICWMLTGFIFALGWCSYFNDAPTLLKEIATFSTGTYSAMWLIGLTLSTYLFAGFVRQKVCIYMCPYGRFQSAMLDKETALVTYHSWRGEPRGRSTSDQGSLGDCIDCGKCVVVCPMGIDIRNGLQLACIGCGLCVDACNSVMEKIGRPLGLIDYDSVNSSDAKKLGQAISHNIFRLKTIIFLSIFMLVSALILYSLLTKASFNLSILREQGPLFTVVPDGSIRNTYVIKVFNKSDEVKEFSFSIDFGPTKQFMMQDFPEYKEAFLLQVAGEDEFESKIFVKIPPYGLQDKEKSIKFILKDIKSNEEQVKHNVFVISR